MIARLLGTPLLAAGLMTVVPAGAAPVVASLLPADGAQQVNPDTQLKLRFDQPPVLGKSGLIRIYDAVSGRLVDTLDLSIPAGPTERTKLPQAPYLATPYVYADGPRATNANTKAGTPSAGAEPGDTRCNGSSVLNLTSRAPMPSV